ncbi:MAG: AAA family ATPase [Gammaproteobacteria bacterium]|nr:AAA family ATPase [Gammaproteobacteria bacterium]MBU2675577.1 AAA family ATPase [Gammaproteobacteria bacterium]NNC57330.1 AAA family ATPase [Woeseiaceae bacterium]NNL49312.1 AAA family ATPase [Woeseiaceae bacterium]
MSYLEHFGLAEQPFRLTPDPDFIYWSKQHARAKAYMESTIWLADGFVVITGEIGSGKTTLLQSFISELEDDVVYAVVSQTQLTATQFLQAVLTEFGFKPFNMRKVELLDMLNMFLIEQYSNGKKVVLIVDEAQNLTRKVLEEIRLISGIETHKEKVLRIILAGQPELRDNLNSPSLKQLVQRVRLRFHLSALDRRETREYIEHRLSVAGRKRNDLFTDDSLEVIQRFTDGVPRLVNTLCDTALLCAFADEKKVVGTPDVLAAVNELDWRERVDESGIREKLRHVPDRAPVGEQVTKIEVHSDDEVVSEYTFPLGRAIIGRSRDNEIFVNSKFVSRHHAQLVSDDKGCVIEDLNSTNGVFLGEKQVKKYRLRSGDRVSVGVHELTYYDLRVPQQNLESSDKTLPDAEDGDQDSAVNEQ